MICHKGTVEIEVSENAVPDHLAHGDEIGPCGLVCDGPKANDVDADADGVSVCDGDCDDNNPDVAPGLAETGCDGVDNDCDPETVCVPTSCVDVKTEDPTAEDGMYTLHVEADPAKPWEAYCHDMDGVPRSYLTLQAVGPDRNFSQYSAGGAAPGSNVRTNFTRVLFDPNLLRVVIDDTTFATSSGQLKHPNGPLVTRMPYGAAESCGGPAGLGNIDLTGLPFKIFNGFCVGGFGGAGSAVLSNDDKVADFAASGFCGWITPLCTFDPQNMANGGALLLEYVGL